MKRPDKRRAAIVMLEALIALAFVFAVLGTLKKLGAV
jgi:hypothetical protein